MEKINIENTPKSVFTDKEHYLKFVATWKQLAQAKTPLPKEYYCLYSMLRNRNWTKCFTSVTNKNKLANGREVDDTLKNTLTNLNNYFNYSSQINVGKCTSFRTGLLNKFLEPFKDIITPEMLIKLLYFIPTIIEYEQTKSIYKVVQYV